jgi:hypothetical protein
VQRRFLYKSTIEGISLVVEANWQSSTFHGGLQTLPLNSEFLENVMTMKFWRSGLLSVVLVLLVPAVQSTAQDRPLKKIYWGISTLSPTLWIPYVAKDAKLFEKNGLDVELVLLRGSGQTSQAMVAGSLFASSVALPAVMLADLN